MIKIFILVVVVLFLVSIFKSYLLYKKTVVLEKDYTAFSRAIPNASMRILVLGDSTAVGTGVKDAKNSTAGRLSNAYPNAEVVNVSENGLKIAGLIEKLKTFKTDDRFDIVLIQIGANDIIRFTADEDIKKGIDTVLARTKLFGGKVVLLHSGDIGDSKFFPWYVRPILSYKTNKVRKIYIEVIKKYDSQYVDLIESPVSNLLKENPQRYYAADLLHLSDDGYGLWFDEIYKKLTI